MNVRLSRPVFLTMFCVLVWTSCSSKRSEPEASAIAKPQVAKLDVNWDMVKEVSKATPTLQVVVSPLMRRGAPTHDRIFQDFKDLGCNYVRYVPWLPYPKLAVAELEPPKDGKTSWNFSLIDPMMEDFMNAADGHSVVVNFSTIPQWMFKTPKPVNYPSDPYQVTWKYEEGTELRDPTMKEVADYYARLVSWYTKGGFSDQYGKWHESGHHYNIQYWEVLNEVDGEHRMTAESYTRLYDAIVAAIHKVDPSIKFVGMALAAPAVHPEFFEHFLNHKNHKAGIPLDMISYHFYAVPTPDQTPDVQQYTFFAQADHFLDVVRYIQEIRERLSPQTGTYVDEIGAISTDDMLQKESGHITKPIPNSYWNLCAAMYAYLYGKLAALGVEGVGESALAQLPTFFPSVTMVNWKTGQPNARYWVLKLLRDNFGPGDKLVSTDVDIPYVYAQGFVTPKGEHKLLLVNQRDRTFEVSIPGVNQAHVTYVDQTTGFQPPASTNLRGHVVALHGFSVAIVTVN